MASDTRPVWVLGGGGVAGIAWEIGVLTGLADEGVTMGAEHVTVGTSAGSVVGAQVRSGTPLEELYERQSSGRVTLVSPGITAGAMWRLATIPLFSRSAEAAARRVGRGARQARIADPSLMMRVVADRLPDHEWPDADLRLTAVDAESGELRVFTREDGVPLVAAVAASCCIPYIMPPVLIEGRHYIDGGMRSTLNLDLVPGTGPVIALAPSTASMGRWGRLSTQRAALGDRIVEVVSRDEASRKAQGLKVMDRSILPAVAAAAREQGRREATRVRAALGPTA